MPEHPVPHPDVAGFVLGALEPWESEAFGAHLGTCQHCQREVANLASIRDLLDQAEPSPVPPGLAERTLAAVAEAAATPAPLPELLPRRRRARRVGIAAGLAVAIVALATLAGGLRSDSGREVDLVAVGGGSAAGEADLRRGDSGIAVELAVEGLAVPPPGSFYECWYVAEEDSEDRPARLSAGTFTVKDSGTTDVRMTTAANPSRYPRIEVTLEPDDGDPRRTGPVVLQSRPPLSSRSSMGGIEPLRPLGA